MHIYDYTLLQKMMELGIPMQFIHWVAAFLRTRTAEVMINGTLSKRVRMKQGLPQGSVLSPLLFVIFINDILKELPEDVIASLFADDAAVYAMDQKLVAAQDKLQKGVSAIEKWSIDNKLDLNLKKSCTYFFSTDSHEAKWRPNILLLGSRMRFGEGERESYPQNFSVSAWTGHSASRTMLKMFAKTSTRDAGCSHACQVARGVGGRRTSSEYSPPRREV